LPQLPQFSRSVVVSRQLPLQFTSPAGQLTTQVLPMQI
jgi:hypothetical protein